LIASIFSYSYIKKTWYLPKYGQAKIDKLKAESDLANAKAEKELWKNRFNVPCRPLNSIEDLMTFIGSEDALNKAV
jgi:hypothetical protein